MSEKSAPEPTRLQVASVVAFYMASALIMVLVNKAVLLSVPALPFAFLWAQIVIAVLLLHLSQLLFPKHFELPKVNWTTIKLLTPVISTGMAGLALNTLCLATVDTSFFIIARGLALPLTIGISSFVTKKIPGWRVFVAAGIVTFGFSLGVYRKGYINDIAAGTKTITYTAIIVGVASSFFLALHAVLVKSAIKHVDGSIVALTYYSNLLAVGCLLPFIFINGEHMAFIELVGKGQDWLPFIAGSAVTGLFGFLLGIAGLLSIKVTSPITHMFSSAGRSVLQTILGVSLFNDIITPDRGASIGLITLGAMYYTWVMSNAPPPPAKTPIEEEESMLHDMENGDADSLELEERKSLLAEREDEKVQNH